MTKEIHKLPDPTPAMLEQLKCMQQIRQEIYDAFIIPAHLLARRGTKND